MAGEGILFGRDCIPVTCWSGPSQVTLPVVRIDRPEGLDALAEEDREQITED